MKSEKRLHNRPSQNLKADSVRIISSLWGKNIKVPKQNDTEHKNSTNTGFLEFSFHVFLIPFFLNFGKRYKAEEWSTLFTFYKNIYNRNIKAEICEIIRIF